MTTEITRYLSAILCAVLAMAMVLSSNSRIVSHDYKELAKIVADHQAEIQEHGHAHEDVVDLIHAYHGHVHDTADHDHNIAFLVPRGGQSESLSNREIWSITDGTWADRSAGGFDRPPRV